MRAVLLVLAVLGAAGGCKRDRAPLAVRTMDSPAKPGSGEPNLAVAPDGRVLLSWIEPVGEDAHALRYAARTSGGAWSEPRTVAQGSGWIVNWADFPAMTVLPDGTLFAHWLAKSGPGKYAYGVHVARSTDGGQAWSDPVVPHRDGTDTEHGFVSMIPWSTDAAGIVWLDGRNTAGHEGEHAAPAAMSLMHATLGRDGTLGDETVLDNRVCDCCQTDMARADGAVVVVYRDRSEKEVRDMSVVRFAEGRWSTPRRLASDGWQINGCPVNGPAVAAAGSSVAVAWFTAPEDKPRVAVAFSSDSGASFGAPIVVDDGRPLGRVDVALREPATAVVSWLAQGAAGTTLQVREVRRDGSRGDAITVADSSAARSSGFPRMVAAGSEVVMAWRDPAEPPKVRTAVLAAR